MVGRGGSALSRRTARPTHRLVAAAVALLVLAAGACGGSDGDGAADPGAAATGSSTTAPGSAEAVAIAERYLGSLTGDGGPDTDAMVALSAPGSVAERYAVHTGALAEIQIASGEDPESGTVSVDGDTVTVTFSGAGGPPVETTWTDFTIDGHSRLDDFTINGVSLDDRLIVGGESDTTARVTATITSAFELVTNDSPVVIVEIQNGSRREYRLRHTLYATGPDEADQASGSDPSGEGLIVAPGATERAALIFGSAPFGGTVTLVGELGGSRGVPVRQELSLAP